MSDTDDTSLLESARSGDTAALDALLARYEAQIYRFGMKMCRHPEDAKDVLQETLLALARGVREVRGEGALSTWLYAVARSHCIKKRRRRKDAPDERSLAAHDSPEAARIADGSKAPDEALADKQIGIAIERAMTALDAEQREVLFLRDVEGLSAAEVAVIVGASVQAVKSRLHRARLSVRAAVAPLLGAARDIEPRTAQCPDVLTLFSKHLEGEIDAALCARMELHVDGCTQCKSTCDSLKRTLVLCKTTSAQAPVPADVQASVRAAVRRMLEAPAS